MRIERMTTVFLAAVAELERLCFSDPWSENALGLLLEEERAVGVVCLEADRVIAYGGMLIAPDEGQITNIATHPDARRRGAGRAVLRALLAAATERGLLQVSLEVRASHAAAIALYESEGFFVAGRRKNFYRAPTEDGLVMLCTLPTTDGGEG